MIVVPFQVNILTPLIKARFAQTASPSFMDLRYPATYEGKMALFLWSAGFETIFFYAAPMSFFSRLTGSRRVALILTVFFRLFYPQVLLKKQDGKRIVRFQMKAKPYYCYGSNYCL